MKQKMLFLIRQLIAYILLLIFPGMALASEQKKIVSLAPSLTEIVYALGAQNNLVGVTRHCDYPPEAKEKFKVGDFVSPSVDLILQSGASVILATAGNPKSVLNKLEKAKKTIVYTDPKTVRELPKAIETVGHALGKVPKARELSAHIQKALDDLAATQPAQARTFLVVLQSEPLISVSDKTWLGDLLKMRGLKNIVGVSKLDYPVVSKEILVANKPDIVFIGDYAMSGEGAESDIKKIETLSKQRFQKLLGTSAPLPRFVVMPNDILVRPGPRIIEAVSFLKSLSL